MAPNTDTDATVLPLYLGGEVNTERAVRATSLLAVRRPSWFPKLVALGPLYRDLGDELAGKLPGYAGWIYPDLSGVSFADLRALYAEMWQELSELFNVPGKAIYDWPELWTPGAADGGYTEAELSGTPGAPCVLVALRNATDRQDVLFFACGTDGNPVPFDSHWNNELPDDRTQVGMAASAVSEFAATHADSILKPTSHHGAVTLALMDLVEVLALALFKPKKYFKNRSYSQILDELIQELGGLRLNPWRYVRIVKLGRRTVHVHSRVGHVGVSGDRALHLDWGSGSGYLYFGVSLSAGVLEG